MRLLVLLCSAAVTLTGCATRPYDAADSPFAAERLAGTNFVLEQPLTVPAGRARVFLQDGAAVRGFDQYRPHCALEIRSVQHDGFEVAPGVFRITRVQHSLERVVDLGGRDWAWLSIGFGLPGFGSSSLHEGYHFWLDAPGRPEVMRLSCYGTYDRPPDLRPPTLTEIRQVLGGLGEIGGN